MDPVGDVALKDLNKWAAKNLTPQRISDQAGKWYKVYDQVKNMGPSKFRLCLLGEVTTFLLHLLLLIRFP